MIWWMRVNRVISTAAGLAVMLALVAVAGGSRIPAPNLLQGVLIGTPLATVLPLLVVGVFAHGLASGAHEQAAVAVRDVVRYRLIYSLAICGITAVAGLALTLTGVQPLGVAAARNVAGYMGLALVGGALVGRHAAIALPTGYLFLVIMTGSPPGGEPPLYMWPLASSGDVGAIVLAGFCFGAGVLLMVRRRKDPQRQL
ncbi:hypothetical protein [Actinomadura hibisca]|uniref:hypothetical protein n=1 Tax=Actinomadura hibisca TaxID=68565 RepID=UPI000AD47315|nr:hypothetical protein [Actinomadura hibisca]